MGSGSCARRGCCSRCSVSPRVAVHLDLRYPALPLLAVACFRALPVAGLGKFRGIAAYGYSPACSLDEVARGYGEPTV
jgi:hypothetical protein